jgi:hypothetical protein
MKEPRPSQLQANMCVSRKEQSGRQIGLWMDDWQLRGHSPKPAQHTPLAVTAASKHVCGGGGRAWAKGRSQRQSG